MKKKMEEGKEKQELNTWQKALAIQPLRRKPKHTMRALHLMVKQANSEYCLDFFFLLHAMMWTWLSLLQSHLGRGLRVNRKKKENLSVSIHLSLPVTVGRM